MKWIASALVVIITLTICVGMGYFFDWAFESKDLATAFTIVFGFFTGAYGGTIAIAILDD